MEWTTEPITEPGWFWFIDGMGAFKEMVFLHNGQLRVGGDSIQEFCRERQWCRISGPEED